MPTVANAHSAAVILRDRLNARLRDDYPALAEARGGVRVVLETDEPGETPKGAATTAKIAVNSDEPSVLGSDFHDIALGITIWAGTESGAKTGEANPVGSDVVFSQALLTIAREDRTILHDTGLYGNSMRFTGQRTEQGEARDRHTAGLEFRCFISTGEYD